MKIHTWALYKEEIERRQLPEPTTLPILPGGTAEWENMSPK
jgi:hypothetical protein